jgi:hypothetical protein
MLRDLFNGDVDLLLDIVSLLNNLLEMLGEAERPLKHLLSSIPIDPLAKLIDEKVFLKHVSLREHGELDFNTGGAALTQ